MAHDQSQLNLTHVINITKSHLVKLITYVRQPKIPNLDLKQMLDS
jgi:hypothetical protein